MTAQLAPKPHYDENGKVTGLYECPICGELFKPNPADQPEMGRLFKAHLNSSHGDKPTREDLNQAAARTVKEATDKI